MVDVLLQNGGTPIGDENDTECTHMVCFLFRYVDFGQVAFYVFVMC